MHKLISFLLCIVIVVSCFSALSLPASAAGGYYITCPTNGDYVIVPEANSNFALDVSGGGAAPAKTSIGLWQRNGAESQIFTLQRVNGDWYKIIYKRTGQVINVQNGTAANDARLQTYPFDNTNACFFRFAKIGSSYLIQSKVQPQNYLLDLDDAKCYNGSIIHLWSLHDNLSARWKLIPVAKEYFPRYDGSSGSIITAFNKIGCDSSYSYRSKVAIANGISNYSGKSSENIQLLNLVKQGKLLRPEYGATKPSSTPTPQPNLSSNTSGNCFSKYTGSSGSITSALKSLGIDSSFSYRAQIAAANNISGYVGSYSQNVNLLNLLKQGKLKKPGSAPSSSEGEVTVNSSYNVYVSNPAKETSPHYTNTAGKRGPEALNTVIDQFAVTSNSRYRPKNGKTYCNIFAWDCTRALGAEIPHWVLNNKPATSNTRGAKELNANATYNWLNNYGSGYGWYKTTASEAQKRANAGYPTVAVWRNTSGGSGHIAVIRPEGSGYIYTNARGPVIAQAGGSNYSYANISIGFGSSKMSNIVYWTHD